MKKTLEWMGENCPFVEKMFRFFNIYARMYTAVYPMEGTEVEMSSAAIQTLEAVLKADGEMKMIDIADQMGITRGTFSNNVKRLIQKGYLKKEKSRDNNRDIFLRVTETGKKAYEEYVKFVYDSCFRDVFRRLDHIPKEYQEDFAAIFDALTEGFMAGGKRQTRNDPDETKE